MAAGQWEFQVFAKGAKRAGDETWVARYLLERTGEKYGLAIEWHPKPLGHTRLERLGHARQLLEQRHARTAGNEEVFTKICEQFGKNIDRHINVYGADNEQRLTGASTRRSRSTQFSFGVSDRGASIRIPVGTVEGRLEGPPRGHHQDDQGGRRLIQTRWL